jgi:hypothetical protein
MHRTVEANSGAFGNRGERIAMTKVNGSFRRPIEKSAANPAKTGSGGR